MQPQPQVTGVNVGPPGFVPAQQPGPMMVIPARRAPTPVPSYQHRQSVYLGVTLVVCGILSIVFNIVDIILNSQIQNEIYNSYYHYSYRYYYSYYNYNSLGCVGHGFWSGIMCIIAGSFGIGAGRRRSACSIRACIVLCILAASFCLGQLIVAVIGASLVGTQYSNGQYYCCTGSCYYYSYYNNNYNNYGYYDGYYATTTTTTTTTPKPSEELCRETRALIAMESLLAILSAIAGVAAIWAATLGCRAACCCSCCCCKDPFPRQFTAMPNGAQMMVITTSQQQGQQMVPVAYPPQYYPAAYQASYQPGANPQPGYQFAAAPPYYPPPSTVIAAPQSPQPYIPPLADVPPPTDEKRF